MKEERETGESEDQGTDTRSMSLTVMMMVICLDEPIRTVDFSTQKRLHLHHTIL